MRVEVKKGGREGKIEGRRVAREGRCKKEKEAENREEKEAENKNEVRR